MTSHQSSRRHGIISACSWTLDRIKIIDEWPEEEHLAKIIATDQQGGGCGYNLGVDIRRLDSSIPVEAIGLTGDDADGSFLHKHVAAAGIDVKQLQKISDVQTSFTDVFTDTNTGKRTFFHHPGASDHITPDHFDFTQSNGRILHLGLLGVHKMMDSQWLDDSNGWVSVLRAAKQHDIHTNLELVSIAPQQIRNIALPCIPYLDSLVVNEYELGAVAGVDVCTSDNTIDEALFKQAADKLFAIKPGNLELIVAHCPTVAYAMTKNGNLYTKMSFRLDTSQIVSSVGAGDAFAAGILYGVHQRWDLDDSLELAHAAAACSLRSATTVGAVESVDDCLAFARSVRQ